MNKSSSYPIDLVFIEQEAADRGLENEQFRTHLEAYPGNLDTVVQELNARIAPQVDCTSCGNCCRTLMINVTPVEAETLANQLGASLPSLKETHLEESMGGQLIINTIPCHFLHDNKCSIYTDRFTECRDFPALHRDGFRERIFSTLMHYGRCPIVYHLIQELKGITNFVPENTTYT
jgi:Fe-S-cluster containining protein